MSGPSAGGEKIAHTGFEPAEAAPGSIVELTLTAADEQPDGSITQVQLQFPEPITVAALPEVPGWTATLDGGALVGAPAIGVTWTGGPAPGDLSLPITLGPLPNEPGRRLQFKALLAAVGGSFWFLRSRRTGDVTGGP